nr:uncharacterized protein LOC105330263 [Crassostrea gigas]
METPYKLFVLVSVYLSYDGLYPVSALSGPYVCDRQETYYTRERVCAYTTWQSCCYYKYVTKCNLRTISYCCSGYTDVGGRCKPVCFGMTGRQGCSNVGNCVGPDTCSCDSGYRGPQCNNKIACSETKPCYPGNCPSVDNCQCSDGFGSPNCTTILASPIITLASAVLAYNHPMKRMDIYNYTTDATTESGTGSGDSASIWANFDQFNKIRGTVSAAFGMESKLSALPSYVTSSKIGVAVATMEWQLEKLTNGVLTRQGGSSRICSEVSTNNPGSILEECQIEFTNVLNIDSGDVFKLTFQVENGGFENLRGNIRLPFTQQNSTASKSSVIYRIDLDKPTVNTNTAFIVDEPFTRTQIVTRWSGWNDPLAGMESYNWEIFELQNKSGTQRYVTRSKADCINPQLGPECNPFLDPIFSQKFNHTGGELSMSYTPTNPGVFAMILEASDRANNSDYVSRYVVYDPSSTIEIQTGDDDIKALSGSKNASFKWQVLSSSLQSSLNLEFSWRGHFINRVHHEGGFLNNIEDYTPQLQDINTGDNKFPKTVNVKYNVVGGNGLTGSLIPNEFGITKFQTYLDETGQQKVDVKGVSWIDQNIKTTASFTLAKTVSEGDFVTLWVKAEDKIGNVKLSSLPLGFDSSKPSIYKPSFMQDMGTKYIYGSKLWFKTADEHSGISQISFNIINKSNNTIAANGSVPVNTSNVERGFSDESYRVRDTFYFYQHELEINNCWFRVPKSRQATDRFEVEIIAYNGAMLQSRQAIDVNLNSFKGIGQYQAVKDVNLLQNTGNGVRFSFNLTESCYKRQNIILKYNDGQDHEKLINPSADKYDLLGLQPLTAYNVSFVVEYDEGDISDPFYYSFRTGAAERQVSENLTTGGIAGIVVAICLLLLFAVFILVMWRTGRLRKVEAVVAPIRNTIRRRRDGNTGAIGYKQYTTGGYDQDEIYMYGEYAYEKEPDWHFRMEDVTLDILLKTGRFAMIYKATLNKHGKPKECVAKTLRDGYSDEDKVLMKAKINFFGAKVGEHPCVLGFFGAVVAEQSMGPIMLLEYCENGTLKDWLTDHQRAVSDDVIENLYRFSYDITRGMVYLASKDIIHMRLATRNVFLNKSLSAKIAGFGPRQGDDEDESGKKERIPVKWMAPECLNKTGTASEKSDVWSYGITIWEIFSIGATPYGDVRGRDLPKWIKQGNRLSKPEYTDDLHYEIMKKCWNLKPSGRPSFAEINKEIESLFRQSSGDLYYYDSSQK